MCCLSECGSSTSAAVLNSLFVFIKPSEQPGSRDGTVCLCGGHTCLSEMQEKLRTQLQADILLVYCVSQ